MANIHPTAIVDVSAQLASSVEVGAYSVIGEHVSIGEGTKIEPHVVVKGPTRIGKHNHIFQFSSIGEACQDLKYNGEATWLKIGDYNVIRESCTLHRGTVLDNDVTHIGNHNLLMVNVHVAHDCVLGDHIIIANNSALAGHVHIGDNVILGGFTAVHQFCQIGPHSMTGAGSVVLKDIPAYVIANGNSVAPHGLNSEGLKRRGFSPRVIDRLRRAYKIIYRQGHSLEQAIELLQVMQHEEGYQSSIEIGVMIDSLQVSTRGIIR